MSKHVGIIGWRGMVGSVLLDRMVEERDFDHIQAHFFSTSQTGQAGPTVGGKATGALQDANSIAALAKMDILISCQGGDYTKQVHPALRAAGWRGYWIDAASTLRMENDAVIILDPVNKDVMAKAISSGCKDLIGGNCTVSLMLMATAELFRQGWVQWVNSSTYQAASGAGAKNMRELVAQMRMIGQEASALVDDPAASALVLDKRVTDTIRSAPFPTSEFGAPLAASLIPFIDKPVEDGQSKEEWKGMVETNKILGCNPAIPVDGVCVRVGAMRSHSQALTIKLTRDVPLDEINDAIRRSNDWVRLVPNTKEDTLRGLSPAAVSGTLNVAIGRVRKMKMGPDFLSAFTVGDQLLWGAAEPLRRTLRMLID
ncbi:MAG: aspartate-semialdehyde dehydrogenase [Deltaproteobacteria bacterium]|nr:aspartate-semialdehyde dehydrogenase [Deltaproteobacteria bacterium]